MAVSSSDEIIGNFYDIAIDYLPSKAMILKKLDLTDQAVSLLPSFISAVGLRSIPQSGDTN